MEGLKEARALIREARRLLDEDTSDHRDTKVRAQLDAAIAVLQDVEVEAA